VWVISIVPPESGKGLGYFLIAIGLLNLVLRRLHARQLADWSFSKRLLISAFWIALRLSGLKFMYFGIGIVLFGAGIASCLRT
jgi:hypothetical protein